MLAPWVKKYIGIPFLSNGRNKTSCDCYGLLYLVYKNEFDTELPRLLSDYKNACNVKETKEIFKINKPLIAGEKLDTPEIGDVVLLNYRGLPSHIGIYAGDGFILHTTEKSGSVLQKLDSTEIKGRVEGYYRVNKNYRKGSSL